MSVVQLMHFSPVNGGKTSDFWLLDKGKLLHRSSSLKEILKRAGSSVQALPASKDDWPGAREWQGPQPIQGLPMSIAIAVLWGNEQIAENQNQFPLRFWVTQPDEGLVLSAHSTLTEAAQSFESLLRSQLPF